MGCYRCYDADEEEYFWVCDPMVNNGDDDICDDDIVLESKGPKWNYKWTQTVPEGTWKVWCQSSCDAKLAKAEPQGSPPWHEAGKIDLEAGDYKLSCKVGKGECRVRVVKVEEA